MGGYFTPVTNTVISVSDHNTYVRDQTVNQFASAAARASAITSPVEGMVSYQSDTDLLYLYDGAAWVAIPRSVVQRKTADETVNNTTTLQNDDHLLWTVAASGTYLLELHIGYNTGTTPDAKIAWTYPSGLTMKITGIVGYEATSTLLSQATYTESSVIPLGGGSGDNHFSLWGLVFVSSTAGTLQLQWAQNTANASDTIFRNGSYGLLTKIG